MANVDPLRLVLAGDFDAALKVAQADAAHHSLAPGLAAFAEAGRLMGSGEWVAARNAMREAGSTPGLGRLSHYWRCKLAKVEKGLRPDDRRCMSEAGIGALP